MIEIKLIWIQVFAGSVGLWFALNFLVLYFNIVFFWGDDDQLKRTPLIATIIWIVIVLGACFIKVVP